MTIDPALYLDGLEYIPAANMRPRSEQPNLIVIHTMESSERDGAAKSSAQWHASGQTIGSAHIHVDGGLGLAGTGRVVRGVPDDHVANGAAGANARGLHLEQAGRAGQTPDEWADPYSNEVISRAAHVVAAWCVRYGIPARRIGPSDIRAGKSGIAGHFDVSQAFQQSDHWDPGPNYPWDRLMARVQELIGEDVDYLKLSQLIDERIAKSWAEGGASYKGCGTVVKRQLRTQLVDKVLRRPAKSLGEKIAGVFKRP